MKNISFFLALLIVIFSACKSENSFQNMAADKAIPEDQSFDKMDVPPPMVVPRSKTTFEPKVNVPRKVIKTAEVRFEVKDIHESSSKIESMVKDHGADIVSMNQSTTHYHVNSEITIRVPDNSFEKLLNALSSESIHTNYKKIDSEDVTEEFIDISARLKSKKEVHAKYVELMRNKAKTIDDVLKAEEAIRHIQEEIESREGRIRYINNKSSYSTINLSLYQKVAYQAKVEVDPYEVTIVDRFKKSFLNGWEMVIGLVLLLTNFWPLLLIGTFVYWRRKEIVNKIRRNKNQEVSEIS